MDARKKLQHSSVKLPLTEANGQTTDGSGTREKLRRHSTIPSPPKIVLKELQEKLLKRISSLNMSSSSTAQSAAEQHRDGLSGIFMIDVQPGSKAFLYDVDIRAVEPKSRKKPRNLTRVSAALNRQICAELVNIALSKINLQFGGMGPEGAVVYNGQKLLYTSAQLKMDEKVHRVENTEVSAFVRDNCASAHNKGGVTFEVEIKPCETDHHILCLDDLAQYQQQQDSGKPLLREDRSLRAFLELAIAQRALESGNYFSIGSGRLFKRAPEDQSFQGIICFHSGLSKGVRIVEGENEAGQRQQSKAQLIKAAVVMDAKVSAFLRVQTVDQFVREYFRPLNVAPSPTSEHWAQMVHFLRGVKVQCLHNKSRIFTIGGFADKPLSAECFENVNIDGTSKVTFVVDYFKNIWRLDLRNTNLPGVFPAKSHPNDTTSEKEKFPAELLLIIEGQKVPQEKQTPALVELLLKKNSIVPERRHARIEEAGRELCLWDGRNPVLRAFGIQMRRESNQQHIDVRPLPHLLYKNGKEVVPPKERGDWSRNAGVFMEIRTPKKWVIICDPADQDMVRNQFGVKFKETCKEKGYQMPSPELAAVVLRNLFVNNSCEPFAEGWIDLFNKIAVKSYDFVLLIDSKRYNSHGILKLFEVYGRTGKPKLATQQITLENVTNIVTMGRRETLENIVMKLNAKFGGLNYMPRMPNSTPAQRMEFSFCALEESKVLVIGLDVSHPTQKIHEQRKFVKVRNRKITSESGEEKMETEEPAAGAKEEEGQPPNRITSTEPSVVGICANMGENAHCFVGDYFYQTARKESVDHEQLKLRSKWILRTLEANRPRCPRPLTVFVLRDGLSEGQYDMAYHDELNAIRAGFAEYDPNYSPKFVLVIGTKRHFKKFFTNEKDKVENLPPGSIVQKKVVRPDLLEFYMQNHFPVKGTGKAVEYAVLANEVKFAEKDLKNYLGALKININEMNKVDAERLLFKRSLFALLMTLCFSHQIVSKPISLPEPVYQADELAKRGHANFVALKQFFPDKVPYCVDNTCGLQLVDNAKLTEMLSYCGLNAEMGLKNRFTA